MGTQVPFQVVPDSPPHATALQRADKGQLSGMRAQVLPQGVRGSVSPGTAFPGAGKGPGARMSQEVKFEMTRLRERSAAVLVRTDKEPLVGMAAQMPVHIVLESPTLATVFPRADKGLGGVVQTPVRNQTHEKGKLPGATFTGTDKGLVAAMGMQVILEAARATIALCAALQRANKRPFSSMGTQVPLQVGTRGVRFATPLHRAHKGLFSSMGTQVGLQETRISASPGTAFNRADKGFFSGVKAQMSLQVS